MCSLWPPRLIRNPTIVACSRDHSYEMTSATLAVGRQAREFLHPSVMCIYVVWQYHWRGAADGQAGRD